MLLAPYPRKRRRNSAELREKFLRETESFLQGQLRLRPAPTRRFPRSYYARLFGER